MEGLLSTGPTPSSSHIANFLKLILVRASEFCHQITFDVFQMLAKQTHYHMNKFGKMLWLIKDSNFVLCSAVNTVEGISSVTQQAGIHCTFRDPFLAAYLMFILTASFRASSKCFILSRSSSMAQAEFKQKETEESKKIIPI